MPLATKSPISGYPHTRQRRDREGRTVFDISIHSHTPQRARLVANAKEVLACILFVLIFFDLVDADFAPMAVVWFGGQGLLIYFVLGLVLEVITVKHTFVRMTHDSVMVVKFPFNQTFDRKLQHSFLLLPHDKALAESRQHEKEIADAARKGKLLRKEPWFQDSYHVVYLNGHTRIDLCAVHGSKFAAAILARLTYCDSELNRELGVGGINDGAADHLRPDAGDL